MMSPYNSLSRHFSPLNPRRRRNILLSSLLVLGLLLVIILPPAIILTRKSQEAQGRYPGAPIAISNNPDIQKAGPELDPSFLSYSIEFASLPDYAGTLSSPNTYSHNLLANLELLQGSKPVIRVGGNTQDFALLDSDLTQPTNGSFLTYKSDNEPTILDIGKSYFNSYQTFASGTRFIHGFNLALNSTSSRNGLIASVPFVCNALTDNRLLYWELGNEPDLYKRAVQDRPIARPSGWGAGDYVNDWLNLTRAIQQSISDACPDLGTTSKFKLIGPSFSAPKGGPLDLITTWNSGLNSDDSIGQISVHNYMDSATNPGITLETTLLSHKATVASISPHVDAMNSMNSSLNYILGETNSVYGYGASFFANSFGAALWNIDYALWCASVGIYRIHMHQGTNYAYGSWQPVNSDKEKRSTKASYYGNIATTAMLGNLTDGSVRIANVPLKRDSEAAYATYVDGQPKRLMVVNMQIFNTSSQRIKPAQYGRPSITYPFKLPVDLCGSKKVAVRRLVAAGTDVLSGITFDGYSFNFEVNDGKPSRLANVTVGERIDIGSDGSFEIVLPISSAVMLELDC